jgi:Tfp pilus assembly protein PilN
MVVVHVGIVPRTVLDPWIGLFRSARLALTGASLSSLSWAHGATVLWGTSRPAMVLAAENDYVEGALIRDGRIHAVHTPGVPSQVMPAAASQLMRSGRVDSADQLRLIGHGAKGTEAGLESQQLPIEGAGTASNIFGAVSTALLGLVRSGFRLNLIPSALRHQRNYFQFVPTYVLLLLLVLLALGAWLREPYQQSLYAQRLDKEGTLLAAQVRSVADQETRLNKISDRSKALDILTHGRDSNLEALRELSRVLPKGTFLTSYVSQDSLITISGFSESAASIQKLLEDSPVFRDAQFVTSITRDASGKDRFTLKATIEARP